MRGRKYHLRISERNKAIRYQSRKSETETAVLYISLVANKHPMSQYNGRSQRPLPLCIQKKAACNSKREQMLIHANDSLNVNGDVTMCCTAVMDTTNNSRPLGLQTNNIIT